MQAVQRALDQKMRHRHTATLDKQQPQATRKQRRNGERDCGRAVVAQ